MCSFSGRMCNTTEDVNGWAANGVIKFKFTHLHNTAHCQSYCCYRNFCTPELATVCEREFNQFYVNTGLLAIPIDC